MFFATELFVSLLFATYGLDLKPGLLLINLRLPRKVTGT